MLKDRNNIDSLFKEGLYNYEVSPPEYVWNSIESSNKNSAKQRQTIVLWRSIAAAACIAAVVTISILYINNQTSTINSEIMHSSIGASEYTKPSLHNITEAKKTTTNNTETPHKPIVIKDKSSDPKANKTLTVPEPNDTSELNNEQELSGIEWIKKIQISDTTPVAADRLIDNRKKEYYPLYASSYTTPQNKQTTIRLGGVVSPSYNSKSSTSQPQAMRSLYANANESGINSLGGGIQVRVNRGSRWSLETGVLYAQVGQEVNNSINTFQGASELLAVRGASQVQFQSSLGNLDVDAPKTQRAEARSLEPFKNEINTSLPGSSDIKQTLDYIEIPMLARYQLIKSFPYLTVAGGFSSNFLIDNNVYSIDNGSKDKIGETKDIKPFVISSSVGIGIDLPITKDINLNVEPRLKYFLNSVNSNDAFNFQPYSFGVFGGITFVIK